jgi:large subunit ribosomal protein L29
MLKARDLREQPSEELEKLMEDLQEQLFKLRFQKATGQMDDVHKIANVRKDLARVITVIKEKSSQQAVQEEQLND